MDKQQLIEALQCIINNDKTPIYKNGEQNAAGFYPQTLNNHAWATPQAIATALLEALANEVPVFHVTRTEAPKLYCDECYTGAFNNCDAVRTIFGVYCSQKCAGDFAEKLRKEMNPDYKSIAERLEQIETEFKTYQQASKIVERVNEASKELTPIDSPPSHYMCELGPDGTCRICGEMYV